MKRFLCVFLTVALVFPFFTVRASEKIVLLPQNADYSDTVTGGEYAEGFAKGKYIGFSKVDLTGINQVMIEADVKFANNGETIRLIIDDPKSGEEIGFVTVSEEKSEYYGFVGGAGGVHDLYFVGSYLSEKSGYLKVKSFSLLKEPYEDRAFSKKVSDDLIKDYYEDTWAATDSFGRRVADYSETGDVKSGQRKVGMLYWHWFNGNGTTNATVISDVIEKHPDAMSAAGAAAWSSAGMTVWDEPVYGYYNSFDYWVYRRHIELLAAAGVDAVLPDCSNGGSLRIKALNVMAQATRDAIKDGINAPKLSIFTANWTNEEGMLRLMSAIYYSCFQLEDYSDIWFYWDGKPLIFGEGNNDRMKTAARGDSSLTDLSAVIENFFTWRKNESGKSEPESWTWIETFPQLARGKKNEEGRPEFVAVGVSKNAGYVGVGSCANDKYAMGRSYSGAFGDDYSERAIKEQYYFKEEAALALDYDPEFILVDGWNELKSDLYRNYGGYDLAFPDTFDSDNSRDFEPVRGLLKDDSYMMLTDFIRKYKGVRPAPVSEEMTVDIEAGKAAWEIVKLKYCNYKGEDRKGTDGYISDRTGALKEYSETVKNRVLTSKASHDKEYFYFMAQTDKDYEGGDGALSLLINSDKNPKTGENGYDYILGRKEGRVEKIIKTGDGFSYEDIGSYKYFADGDTLGIRINRALIENTESFDMEIKWVSGGFHDVLDFYSSLNTAPIGRFNYVFTDKKQAALTSDEREFMKDKSAVYAGKNKMIANGGIVYVNEADISTAPFEMNGTLYVPESAFNEIAGWGKSKTEYDAEGNILYIYNYRLKKDSAEYEENNWYYTVVGSNEAYINGRAAYLSAPVIASGGEIWIPVSAFSSLMGRSVTPLGAGGYLIGGTDAPFAEKLYHYIAG